MIRERTVETDRVELESAPSARKARGLTAAAAALGVALLVHPSDARAELAGRTAVVAVEGESGGALATLVASRIVAPHRVTDAEPFVAALAAVGTRSLAAAVGNRAADAQLVARARATANDQHVDVVILVAHKKTRHGVRAHLWIIDAHGEGTVADEDLTSDTPSGEATEVWNGASDLFPAAPEEPSSSAPIAKGTHVASEPGPTTETPLASDRSEDKIPGATSSGVSHMSAALIAQVNAEGGSRHFSYVDRLTGTLRPYDLFAAPMASIDVEAYPLAHARLPGLAGVGITGDYARAFGVTSADSSGARVGTAWSGYDLGLRYRLALSDAIALGVNLGYGAIDFNFDQPSFSASAVLPDASYRFLRGALDVRATRGDMALFGGGGYLDVLSTGQLGVDFPRESVGGVEAHVGAAYTLAVGFELSLGISYTRFFYSMNPQPGDANVAGGALDQMARVALGVTCLL